MLQLSWIVPHAPSACVHLRRIGLLQSFKPARHRHITSTYYLISLQEELNATQQTILTELLGTHQALPLEQLGILSMPRVGTVSPESSKALDVLHSLGLKQINTIAWGALYHPTPQDIDYTFPTTDLSRSLS